MNGLIMYPMHNEVLYKGAVLMTISTKYLKHEVKQILKTFYMLLSNKRLNNIFCLIIACKKLYIRLSKKFTDYSLLNKIELVFRS